MADEEGEEGEKRGEHYRRMVILSVLCFLFGIWLIVFPIFDYPWRDTGYFRLWFDFLTFAGGVIMVALGFTLWRVSVS
jgi:hypothetical protein